MDYYTAIRLNALDAVLSGDNQEYVLRHIFRWYSKTFATPLNEVEELPLEDVLTHYYETKYEDMKDIEIDMEKASLLETNEERQDRMRKLDEEKALQLDLTSKKELMEELFRPAKKKEGLPGLGDITDQINKIANIVSGDKKDSLFQERPYKMREPILPSPIDFPEISMKFLPDDEELPLDMDPLAFSLLKRDDDDNLK